MSLATRRNQPQLSWKPVSNSENVTPVSDHPFLSLSLSVCLFVCLSVCLSVSLFSQDGSKDELRFSYNNKVLIVGRPGVNVSNDFTVTIN